MLNACSGPCPYIMLRDCVNVSSAGEDWTENPETYESSFYKRTLDNEIYIFTAPSFTSKFSERLMYVYGFCAWGSSVWSGTEPILLSAFGRHPNPTGKDHTLRPLISLSLSFSFFPLCLSALIPALPPALYTSCYLH